MAIRKGILSSGVQKLNRNRFKMSIFIRKVCSSDDIRPHQQAKKC